ncbi:RDD family protein [Pararhodobacter sp. CCB-MM2]|uniref:RDD family protein n=1 Tax=Pararhodobacter sp. CCB-MM2 TaxID=1786003 RepID=UPI00082D71A0|nr:RDD family protein [Pararhodobacter sp. CCB-MM2]
MRLPDPDDHPELYEHLIAKRLLAWVIDVAVTALLVIVALILTGGLALLILPLLWGAISIAYRTTLLNRYSATLGMLVASTRLCRLDGQALSPQTTLLHSITYSATMAFVLPQIGSIFLMLNSPYKQGLNDWLLGTTIVNKYIVS